MDGKQSQDCSETLFADYRRAFLKSGAPVQQASASGRNAPHGAALEHEKTSVSTELPVNTEVQNSGEGTRTPDTRIMIPLL
jgi:hypothetical protein